VPLPPLTPAQRAEALARATEARRVRAAVRADLRRPGLDVAAALAAVIARGSVAGDHGQAIGKMRVAALLEAVPGIGKVRAAAIMERLEISPSRRIRGLGAKQRAALAREFTPDSGD
jgi:hypothetical protein